MVVKGRLATIANIWKHPFSDWTNNCISNCLGPSLLPRFKSCETLEVKHSWFGWHQLGHKNNLEGFKACRIQYFLWCFPCKNKHYTKWYYIGDPGIPILGNNLLLTYLQGFSVTRLHRDNWLNSQTTKAKN